MAMSQPSTRCSICSDLCWCQQFVCCSFEWQGIVTKLRDKSSDWIAPSFAPVLAGIRIVSLRSSTWEITSRLFSSVSKSTYSVLTCWKENPCMCHGWSAPLKLMIFQTLTAPDWHTLSCVCNHKLEWHRFECWHWNWQSVVDSLQEFVNLSHSCKENDVTIGFRISVAEYNRDYVVPRQAKQQLGWFSRRWRLPVLNVLDVNSSNKTDSEERYWRDVDHRGEHGTVAVCRTLRGVREGSRATLWLWRLRGLLWGKHNICSLAGHQ